jgi:hypothetical protein
MMTPTRRIAVRARSVGYRKIDTKRPAAALHDQTDRVELFDLVFFSRLYGVAK